MTAGLACGWGVGFSQEKAGASRTLCFFSFDHAGGRPGSTGIGSRGIPIVPDRRRKGRAEVGLDNQLRELTTAQVPPGPRAGLRVLARGLDLAEASGDPDLIATAGNAYFHALDLNGLTPAEVAPVDSFADLLAELGRAGAGASDSPQPRP